MQATRRTKQVEKDQIEGTNVRKEGCDTKACPCMRRAMCRECEERLGLQMLWHDTLCFLCWPVSLNPHISSFALLALEPLHCCDLLLLICWAFLCCPACLSCSSPSAPPPLPFLQLWTSLCFAALPWLHQQHHLHKDVSSPEKSNVLFSHGAPLAALPRPPWLEIFEACSIERANKNLQCHWVSVCREFYRRWAVDRQVYQELEFNKDVKIL